MRGESVLQRILNGDEEPKDLPLALLQDITNYFCEERKIGQGGFGDVYKGVLRNGLVVAVKRIHINVDTVDDKLFRREFNSLWKANNHQNIVRFLGFCSNSYQTPIVKPGSEKIKLANVRERLLCFEYISNGSLDKHITDELRGLEWETRYGIIIGICNGLCHLKEKNIIHMDLKPANILLDDHMLPKITDFGLSRPNESSHTIGRRFGTRGYLAPEYENAGKTLVKSDIYSLGAIITELVTGCMGAPDKINVLRRWRHRWSKPPTVLQYQQVTRCIDIAACCRQQEPGHRPSISEIISSLIGPESTDVHTGQVSPCFDEDDMLGIMPLELRLPSELKEEISCFTVELTNDTRSCIAFNIQLPSRQQYNAQPDIGIVQPQSKYGVKITVQARDAHEHDHADKFIVQSMKLSDGLKHKVITKSMFHEEAGKVVDEVNLMVVYVPTKPQENCKSREDTNMPEEVPEVKKSKIVESASGKGKLFNTESPHQNAPVENVPSSESIPAREPPQHVFFPSSGFSSPSMKTSYTTNPAINIFFHPKCDVCKNLIPTNKNGLIEYRAQSFWMQKYCPSHEDDGTPRCCSCERMEPRDIKYITIDDGRKLCLECLTSATMDSPECQHLYIDIQEFFDGLNMKVEQQVPLLLVERQALNEALEAEKSGHHVPKTRGLCLSEEQTVRTILRRPTIGPGNRIIDVITGPYKLVRRCEVTAILILYGLPRLQTGSILAHEMMHAYLRLKGYRSLSPQVEEGICQVLSHMWLESEIITGASGSAASKKGAKTEFEIKLGAFIKNQIKTDSSVEHGDGFRAGNRAVERYALRSTLDHMKLTGSFPY